MHVQLCYDSTFVCRHGALEDIVADDVHFQQGYGSILWFVVRHDALENRFADDMHVQLCYDSTFACCHGALENIFADDMHFQQCYDSICWLQIISRIGQVVRHMPGGAIHAHRYLR